MSQANTNPDAQPTDADLSDDQLTNVAGGLRGQFKEEFEEGLGNKRLSVSVKEEFTKGENKDTSESNPSEDGNG